MNVKKLYHTARLMLCRDGYGRAEYIRKNNLFGHMGENCYFHPYWMPGDPKQIFIHDNVRIAANVTFINHDISGGMLNTMTGTKDFQYYLEPIEVYDNVMIGTGTIILPGKHIGPNCVVGGGTVVSKDIPEGTVVAGNPMRVIGDFYDFVAKRRKYQRG